jgi:hypothetical protein
MPIRLAYQCLTTDIITLYAFNKNAGFLDTLDFSPRWFETIKATAETGHLIKQFPWLLALLAALPDWAISRLSPDIMLILQWKKVSPSPPMNKLSKPKFTEPSPRDSSYHR